MNHTISYLPSNYNLVLIIYYTQAGVDEEID